MGWGGEGTYYAMELASFVACWFARLGGFILARAELAEVLGCEGVGFAEEMDFYAA